MIVRLSFRENIKNKNLPTVTVRIGNRVIYCEVPTTNQEEKIGLKYRDFLATHRGMLFKTNGRFFPLFTMSEVMFDLEAIFVGNDNRIKDIVSMRKLDGSTAYTTSKRVPIKYVIEVGKGICSGNGIDIGDSIYIS